ncbi:MULTISPECIES: hypothetical protein [Streptomyces]|nr:MULTISPECIES: hypothetical protein [Streptomyces]
MQLLQPRRQQVLGHALPSVAALLRLVGTPGLGFGLRGTVQ